jgi:hypothetical protein
MLVDLGLTRKLSECQRTRRSLPFSAEHLLRPIEGTHANLSVDQLIGWQECHRSNYADAFDWSTLEQRCNGTRLLVACRHVDNERLLTLAAIGLRDDLFHTCFPTPCRKRKNRTLISCSSYHQCITEAKRGVGWYHVPGQSWGFVRGSLSFHVNPCDSNALDADYRLCWTLKSLGKHHQSDRCGRATNLHRSTLWQRLVFSID